MNQHPYYTWLEQQCPGFDADDIITILTALGYADAVHQRWLDDVADDEDEYGDWLQRKLVDEQDERFRKAEGEL